MHNRPVLRDHVGGGNGKLKTSVSVCGFHVGTELPVDRLQPLGQGEYQTESAGDLVSGITQHFEAEAILDRGIKGFGSYLGRDGNQACPEAFNFPDDELPGPQLNIAVGSPPAAIKAHHKRSTGEQHL